MKHLSSVVLAAALVAAGVTACFKDSQEPLRNGATRIELTRNAITLVTGDSLAVQAQLKDEQGNVLSAAGVEWATDNAAVATVRVDSIPIPGPAFSRGFVLATAAAGGVAHITVTSGGLTNSFRVLVLPAGLTASASAVVSGTARTDTIVNVLPGGVIQNDIITAGDTVTFTALAGGNLTFDAAASLVGFGATRPYIVSRSATSIKVVAREPFRGGPWVTALTLHGPAETGDIALDSLQSGVVVVSRPRFYGVVTQTGDTMFLNAPTGAAFRTTAPLSGARFGATAAIVLARTATQLKVISPATYTGVVTLTNVTLGAATLDSVKTAVGYTINKASFGGTTNAASYSLLDTVKVYGTSVTKFTTTPAASVSNVSMNGVAAFVLIRTADSMYVIAKRTSTGPLAISNVNVGGTIIPTLNTPANVLIGPTTNDPNEPGNDVRATATLLAFTGAADTITVYGTLDCEDDGTACPGNGDVIDNYQIAYAGGAKLRAIVSFMGTGNPGSGYNDANNPDLDVKIRDGAGLSLTSGATNGAGLVMPEIATTAAVLAAGTFYFQLEIWVTPSPVTYQLRIVRTP
jgi:hypothetical protein